MTKIKTREQFIKDAKAIHGNKYDYSKVEYKGNKTNIKIICPIHGEFEQRPENHLHGFGCKKCSSKYSYTKEEWIENAKSIHGDKYDYSKTSYKNTHTKVKIICPKHGEFKQYPTDHINGCGCQKCRAEKLSQDYTSNSIEFIKKAIKIHGSKYSYDNVIYIDAHTDVFITCSTHGDFKQSPNAHLNGCGCPRCNQSHLEEEVSEQLSNNSIDFKQGYRIDWLGLQHLDFYLPKYNLAIECQGEQHYRPIEQFGGNEGFLRSQERDQRKKQLCEENGVKLLYFTHYDNVDEDNLTFKDCNKLLNEIEKYEL